MLAQGRSLAQLTLELQSISEKNDVFSSLEAPCKISKTISGATLCTAHLIVACFVKPLSKQSRKVNKTMLKMLYETKRPKRQMNFKHLETLTLHGGPVGDTK